LETSRELIPPEQYRELIRGLNNKQRIMVSFHRRWCKDVVIAMKKSKPINPYRVFLVVLVEWARAMLSPSYTGYNKTLTPVRMRGTRRYYGFVNSSYWSCSF